MVNLQILRQSECRGPRGPGTPITMAAKKHWACQCNVYSDTSQVFDKIFPSTTTSWENIFEDLEKALLFQS